MKIESLKKNKAEIELNKYFVNNKEFFHNLHDDYRDIRYNLRELYSKSIVYKNENTYNKDEYKTDLNYALNIYDYFNGLEWYNDSVASNYDFWTYICVKVVPDIIEDRHGSERSYYYEKKVRMYIPTLWWYIHMAYQGNREDTIKCLESLNTDYILQLVERPGRDGMYLNVSRLIMKYIGSLPKKELEKKIDNKNLLRRVLIQNTSKINNYNLSFDEKEVLYVINLFESCGVSF